MYTSVQRFARLTHHKVSGKQITMPNRSIDIRMAIKNMAFGSIENRAGAFYEESGMPIPNFQMMDKIEKLQALSQYREDVISLRTQALNTQNEVLTKRKQKEDEKRAAEAARTAAGNPAPPAGPAGNTGNQSSN